MSRYQFNRDQLRFVEVQRGIRSILKRCATAVAASILLAVAYYVVFASFFNTPEEQELIREQELMKREYERLSERMDAIDKVMDELEERDREIYRTVFQSAPPDLGMGTRTSASLYEALSTSDNVDLVFATQSAYQRLAQKTDRVSQLFRLVAALLTPEKISAIPDRIPLQEIDIQRVGATVGDRIHPFYKTIRMHTGLDLVAARGTNVLAPANGVVVNVTRSSRNSGNSITVEHGSGYTTVYAHLNDILVRRGQRIARGTAIARVGNSGMSLAPHLHYEIWKGDEMMNPIHFGYAQLVPEEYARLMIAGYNSGQSLD